MTPAERKRTARYIRRIADILGLRDWQINLHADEPDTKEAHASISCVYGRRIVNVWLQADFSSLDADTQRHVLVHEMLHVHFDRVMSLAQGTLPDTLGSNGWNIFAPAMQEAVEHGVDAVADALACALPLPE